MATIRDVAAKAGVSRSTVSLVLNKSPLVKEETRELVLQVIRDMNYVPNNNARGLSSNVMNSLGVIIVSETHSSRSYDFNTNPTLCAWNIFSGIMEGLADTDYGVITEYFCSLENPDSLPKIIENRRVDGAFIVGAPFAPELIVKMKSSGIPFVMVGVNSCDPEVDSVIADAGEGCVRGLRYLLKTGHKRICFLNCPSHFPSYAHRKDAVTSLMETKGKDAQFWIVNCDQNQGESGYRAFRSFWRKGNRPDAILVANTQLALGAMRFLHEQGVRVPEDISVMPYEDSVLCGYMIPPLSCINIQKEMLGQKAAQCLIERMSDPDMPPRHIEIPSYLVHRQSVKDRTYEE